MNHLIKLSTSEGVRLALAPAPATVDVEHRTITGKIAAYGKRSSSAKVSLAVGALRPREPLQRVKLLVDHNPAAPVGYMLSYDPETLDASFKIPEGEAGDKALEDAANGLRDGLSIGAMPAETQPDGNGGTIMIDGELYEVSLVAVPDFEDARVERVAASITSTTERTPPEKEHQTMENDDSKNQFAGITLGALMEHGPDAFKQGKPGGLGVPQGFPAKQDKGLQLGAVGQFVADIKAKGNLELALDPIIQADVYDPTSVPDFVGELWAGRSYVERFAPLTTSRTLTSQDVNGWVWDLTPDVGDYAGDLAEVFTNEVKAKVANTKATRTASGHKIDRIHVDMPNGGFWESFYRERARNYAKKRDLKVLNHMLAPANHLAKTTDAGVSDPWAKLVRGALWVLEMGVPQWAIIGADLYEQMALTVDSDKLAYLNASLGLEDGQLSNFKLIPTPISHAASAGKVVVGVNEATEFYELPGGPIRVDALDVAHGGVDAGLFGYDALLTTDARGIVEVTTGV